MSFASVFVSQTRYNLTASVRAGFSVALGIVMPVVLYLVQSSLFGAFSDDSVSVRGAGELSDIRVFFVGGFMAYAIAYGAFVPVASELVDLRERGLLKRLQATPLPLSAFVAARFAISLIIASAAIVLIGAIGAVVWGASLRFEAIVGLVVYAVVGVTTFTCLSFAVATLSRSLGGAQALSNGLGIGLSLISGVFFSNDLLPSTVQTIAELFPLEPLANGFQSLYVTEATGTGIDLRNLAVLTAWTVASAGLVAIRGFRWRPVQQR